jgi:hypothetical protein
MTEAQAAGAADDSVCGGGDKADVWSPPKPTAVLSCAILAELPRSAVLV